MLITDSKALAAFVRRLHTASYVALDTEFLREKTYYAQLCLVQLAHGDEAAAVDPLAPGIDLEPLFALLDDRRVVKVIHSASQDLEVLYTTGGVLTAPVFDTQIAAMACGFGDQPGYAALASALLDVEIDKGAQFTDWSARPLSKRQIDYALGDVIHLCDLYERLTDRIEQLGRATWLDDEMDALLDERNYRTEPEEAWRRVRLPRPTRRALGVLRAAAAWREETARTRNLPRNWVLRDESLAAIALHPPRTTRELAAVRGVQPAVARGRDGEGLLEEVRRALELPPEELPELPPRADRLSAEQDRLVALLQALLKLRCDEAGVAARLVATRAELDQIVLHDEPDVRALRGWRFELFGADALRMKAGQIALTGDGRGVRVVHAPAARKPEPRRRSPRT